MTTPSDVTRDLVYGALPQKRRIDDHLRQLVLIRQDRVLVNSSTCFFTHCDFRFPFFTFPKKWVGQAMGKETFYGDGLSLFGVLVL